uniref:Transposase n=1 Tax=Ditylenchus dipsaci TaxID=166011 RepID=A0A915ETC2_9BILA
METKESKPACLPSLQDLWLYQGNPFNSSRDSSAKKKDGKTYRKMWRKLAAELDEKGPLKLEYAHFDNEPAVYNAFQSQFPDVGIKMCSFMSRQLQSAWEVAAKLNDLINYFKGTWLSLNDFFALHGMKGQITTNTAESYHGKLRHHFRVNSLLENGSHGSRSSNMLGRNAATAPHPSTAKKQSQESAELSARFSMLNKISTWCDNQVNDDALDEKSAPLLRMAT